MQAREIAVVLLIGWGLITALTALALLWRRRNTRKRASRETWLHGGK